MYCKSHVNDGWHEDDAKCPMCEMEAKLERLEKAARDLWLNAERDGDISTIDSYDLKQIKAALDGEQDG